ncbi:MAG: histidine kinase dimerization/phospho-acceptor domain-containing protein [Pseudomonadota bacterium]
MAEILSAGQGRSFVCTPRSADAGSFTSLRRLREYFAPLTRTVRSRLLVLVSMAHICLVAVLALAIDSANLDSRLALALYGAVLTALALAVIASRETRSHLSSDCETRCSAPVGVIAEPRRLTTSDALDLPHSVARLTARMGHDLRTPLNAVIGFSDIMRHELHGPMGHDRYREYAKHIEQSGRALLEATESALTVTHLMARPTQTTDAFAELGDALRSAAISGHALHRLQMTPGNQSSPTFVRCDMAPLVQALARIFQVLADGNDTTAHVRASWIEESGLVFLSLVTAGAPSEANARKTDSTEFAAPPYPAPDDDLNSCLARALCELQGIELSIEPMSDGGRQAKIAIELAEQQRCLFETEFSKAS